jgi:flagellar basal body-associated protein FliL
VIIINYSILFTSSQKKKKKKKKKKKTCIEIYSLSKFAVNFVSDFEKPWVVSNKKLREESLGLFSIISSSIMGI